MLELNKIRKSYDGVTILDNISLSIAVSYTHLTLPTKRIV